MLHDTIKEFYAQIPKGTRILALDVGEKRVGLALSDATLTIGSPHSTFTRQGKKKDLAVMRAIIDDRNVSAIVIGLPKHMNGDEGESCAMVRWLGDKILTQWKIAVYYQDERLSTAAVNRAMMEGDLNRKKRAALDDQLAASYILQTVLESIRNL